jgi:hypothetical protein
VDATAHGLRTDALTCTSAAFNTAGIYYEVEFTVDVSTTNIASTVLATRKDHVVSAGREARNGSALPLSRIECTPG